MSPTAPAPISIRSGTRAVLQCNSNHRIYVAERRPCLPRSVMNALERAVAGSVNFSPSLSRTNS